MNSYGNEVVSYSPGPQEIRKANKYLKELQSGFFSFSHPTLCSRTF